MNNNTFIHTITRAALLLLLALLTATTAGAAIVTNDDFTVNEDGTVYTINNVAGWNTFCNNVNIGENFSGKTVMLDSNIGTPNNPVTTSAGSNYRRSFSGTFDGNGKRLYFAGSAGNPAPFAFLAGTESAPASVSKLNVINTTDVADVDNVAGLVGITAGYTEVTECDVEVELITSTGTNNPTDLFTAGLVAHAEDHLTVSGCSVYGEITTNGKYGAGMVGSVSGIADIENCLCSVTINSAVGGEGRHGGLVGMTEQDGTANITGCVFDGKIVTTNGTNDCGGFVGHNNKGNGTNVSITNSLYAPATLDDDETEVGDDNSYTFTPTGATITNSYYTRTLGSMENQGKQAYAITAGQNVTLALSGDETEYDVSGITAFADNSGLQYDDTYYAGQGDEVTLTLTNTATGAPKGYHYGYSVKDDDDNDITADNLTGSTLTMPNKNVTVSSNTDVLISTHETVEVSYVDAGGNTLTHDAIALDGTESNLGNEEQETWYFVGMPTVAFDHMLNLNGNVNLILADGCTMNVTSNDNGINVNGSLTIYGQTDGTGTLNATGLYGGIYTDSGNITISGGTVIANSDNGDGISTYSGTITISGGTVTATGDNGDGIHSDSGNITISGGRVTATGDNQGIHSYSDNITISGGRVTATGGNDGIHTDSGNITISGGRVTVTGENEGIHSYSGNITISGGRVTVTGENGAGIYTDRGTITLGCTTASDFIYVSKYFSPEGTLNIADGQTLFDQDGNFYSGNGVTIPDGKTLRLYGIALTARQAPDGNYWTTYYNGALGFTIDADENACAYTATYGGSQLTLHKLGKEIPKGTAIIIVADNSVVSVTATIVLPAYSGTNDLRGVNVDTDVDDIRSDLGEGTLYVLGMTTVNNEQHFGFHRYMGEEMAAHKAFVHVGGSPSQSAARSLTMVFDEASGIESAEADSSLFTLHSSLSTWFTLDGRRLQAKPTAPGIYVNNGHKIVIK